LSKALIPDADKLLLRKKEWYSEASVDVISDTVTSVDFSKKSVSTKSGSQIPYTKLVLATGGTPKRLPLPGFKDLKNIFVLRTVNDVKDILAAVGEKKGKKIVVVGSSFIGMEVGNCLSKENTVTIIGMEKAPLERVMGEEVGKIFQKTLEKNGVKFYMGASVDSATPSEKDSKAVGAVKLKDGKSIEADLVILGVGVAPATEYLKDNNSVSLEKDGSLRTDENFKVEGLEDVFAIGDIATYPYHGPGGDGTPTRIEHWSKPLLLSLSPSTSFSHRSLTTPLPPSTDVAQNAGKSVGHTLAKPTASKPKLFIPVFWSALGSQLRYCGATPNGWDSLVLKGEPDNGKFAAYYAQGDTVVAVATMMMDPIMAKCAELMGRGRMPGKGELERGVDVLEVDLVG
jgi:thioredoxin reductase